MFRFKVLTLDPLLRIPWNNETDLDLSGFSYSRTHVIEYVFRSIQLMILKKFNYDRKNFTCNNDSLNIRQTVDNVELPKHVPAPANQIEHTQRNNYNPLIVPENLHKNLCEVQSEAVIYYQPYAPSCTKFASPVNEMATGSAVNQVQVFANPSRRNQLSVGKAGLINQEYAKKVKPVSRNYENLKRGRYSATDPSKNRSRF